MDRRSKPVEHVAAQQQAVERLPQVLGRRMLIGQRLGVDADKIVSQGNGRSAKVAALLREPPRTFPA